MHATRKHLINCLAAYMQSVGRTGDTEALKRFATAYDFTREDREYLAGKSALPIGALS